MEQLPSDTGKNSWDLDDDDDISSSTSKKTKPKAPITTQPDTKKTADDTILATSESLFSTRTTAERESSSAKKESAEGAAEEDRQPELTSEEQHIVIQQYIAERSTILDHELTEAAPDSPTTAIAEADKHFLEHIDAHAQNAELSPDEVLEQAAADTVHELELTQEVSETEDADIKQDDDQNAHTSSSATRTASAQPHTSANTQPAHQAPPTNPVASAPAPPATPTPAARINPMPQPTPAPQATGGNTPRGPNFGGGAIPPTPSPNMTPHFYSGGGGGATYNHAPTAPVAEYSAAPEQTKDRLAQGLLIGGVVGYLVGRRRGRIKTEKRLLPVQEKLQQEVGALHQKIIVKEQEVRSLAAKKAIAEQAATVKTKAETVALPTPEATPVEKTKTVPPTAKPRLPRVETAKTPQQARVEHIVQGKNVDHLPLAQVKQAAETVTVNGTSVAKAFEAGQIDEAGLRHVVAEFARTGQAEHSLRVEIKAHQKRQESAEHIGTIINPEKTVRRQTVSSRTRDRSQVSVQHDITPLDTAGLVTKPSNSNATPQLTKTLPVQQKHARVNRIPVIMLIVAVLALLWFVFGR